MSSATRMARALGVFSLGLGLVQVAAPRRFIETIGFRPRPDREASVRAVGIRELGAAAGLLARPLPVAFMWMRVAGDLLDIALLARARRARDTDTGRVRATTAAAVGVTALDLIGSVRATQAATNGTTTGRRITKAVTIQRPREEVWAYWRDLPNLPRFMHHLEEVRVLDERRSHWVAKAPFGARVEWDAEIEEEVPNERLSWRAMEGAQLSNAGTVEFRTAPGDRGTEVVATFTYDPPAGPLGVAIAKLTGEEPDQQAGADMRRLKQILETGSVVVSDGTFGGRRLRQRPAQPPSDKEVARAERDGELASPPSAELAYS